MRGYSSTVAPISNLFRDRRFALKRARKLLVPWDEEQDQALVALIEIFASPPILALPNWEAPFQLHTDASELGAGAAITQDVRRTERVIGCSSHRWSKVDTRRSTTDREVVAAVGGQAAPAVPVGNEVRPHYRLLHAHVAVQESDPLVKASPVGAQTDGIRHGVTMEAGRKSPTASRAL